MRPARILISGAGIAGLALARRLEQLGIEHQILEKRSASHHGSAGIALPFNAMESLRTLGLAEAVLDHAHQVREVIYAKKNGDVLGRASLLEPPLDKDKFVAMRRDKLHEILLEGIQPRVHFANTIESFSAEADGVNISCSNPALSGVYDLVVSAEGIHSSLRQACFPDEETTIDHRIPNWRFMVEVPNHGMQPIYMLGRSELFMAYPVSPDSLYCYGHVYDDTGQFQHGDPKDHLRQLFGGFGGEVGKLLARLDQQPIVRSRLESVVRPYFAKGRVVFVGDAGNACSPLLQQGAASAFEDILCLAEQLGKHASDEAIEAYRRIRQPRVAWVLKASDNPIKALKMTRHPLGAFLRNMLIRLKGPLNAAGWRQLARQ